MGKVNEEAYFPRGRSSTTKPALRKKKDSLFKKPKKTKKKKNTFYEGVTKKSKDENKITTLPEIKHSIRPLTYQTLEEGMVLLGRVREVLPYHMFVCLPGRLSAKVTVTGISAPYTEAVTKLRELEITEQECPLLTEMFRPGESVVYSIVEVKKDGELLAVTASLDPTLVNTSRSHDSVCAGHTLVAAVRSEEDHGYTMHTGVNGLTAFLPFKETESYVSAHNGGRKLVVGEVVHCLVTKCATAKNSSRAEVTLDPARVARAVTEDITAQTAQPGTAVRCSVFQSTPSGLVVSLGNGKGYIESSQLIHPWSAPEDFPTDRQLKAYVLYSLPHADFQTSAKPVYLTLNHIHRVVTPRIAVGEEIQALVVTSGFKGVWLCLGERKDNSTGNKGFITSRRLGEDVKKEAVAKRFPHGKRVTVRVLAYDYMERLYNCSLEREKLDERYLKLSQLSVGDRVTCRVSNVDTNGLGLTLGSLRLYAFKENCADVPPTNLGQRFSPGDIVDARVLRITETQALVTLKETLIRFPALTSFEMAHKNDCYWGVVRIVKPTHLFILFYNNVRGSMQLEKPHPTYVPGQLVKCYVSYVNAPKQKLTLTAAPEGEQTTTELSVGEEYQLVVTEVSAEHLHVAACDYVDCDGLIPKCHLPEPCTYQEGDFLKAWLYSVSQDKLYFSPNPAIPQLLKKVEVEVFTGKSKVTCCVMTVSKEKVVVLTPFANFSLVTIPKKLWSLDDPKEHQLVELFISKYDSVKNKIKLKCCRSRSKDLKLKTNSTRKDEETSDYFTDDATSKSDMPAIKKQKKKQDENPECKNVGLSSRLENTESEKKIILSNHTIRLLDISENKKRLIDVPAQKNVNKLQHPRCPITGKRIRTRKRGMNSESNDLVSNNSLDAIPKEKDSLITNDTNLLDVPVRKKRKRNQDGKSKSENVGNGLKTSVTSEKKAKLAGLFDMETELPKVKENQVSGTEINISKKTKKKSDRKKKEESHSLKHENRPVNENQIEKKENKLVEEVESRPLNENKKENKKNKLVEKVENRLVNEKKKENKKKKLVEKVENRPVNEKKKNKLVEKILPSLKASREDRLQSIETRKPEPKLTLSEAGFFWDVKPEDLNKPEEEIKDDSDEEVDEGKEGKKRKRGSERRRAAREEEARLREVERTLLETESAPQSADQFDRSVLARPDDADLWIKYMSHHLQATEIEKARAVARRALNTINQRHETERLNVWIALLNLENLFGTQESLKSALDEALRTNDEFTVYSKMLQIYAQAKKSQNAEQLVGVMLRKFRSSPQCWLQCCVALMSCEAYDKARNILRRAVNDLPNKEHVNLLCKFALLENQHGFSEQAQTLFDHILTSYPKRIDIWSVYVDMLVKSDKLDVARQVLGRATKQKLPARKMKTVFSKWIGLEERLGSADTVENVKKLALAYVNNITKSLES